MTIIPSRHAQTCSTPPGRGQRLSTSHSMARLIRNWNSDRMPAYHELEFKFRDQSKSEYDPEHWLLIHRKDHHSVMIRLLATHCCQCVHPRVRGELSGPPECSFIAITMLGDFPDDLEASTWAQTSSKADFQRVVFFFSISMI